MPRIRCLWAIVASPLTDGPRFLRSVTALLFCEFRMNQKLKKPAFKPWVRWRRMRTEVQYAARHKTTIGACG